MFSQSCVSGFHRISDHGESRRARLSATTTPSWRHIWSSTYTKPPSLDHTRNCQPSPNQLSNFNLQQGSPPPTQSLPQIPSSTHTNDPTSLDHPPTPNTSPPSSTRQISIFNRGHHLPPNLGHRFRHPRTQTTPHHSIIHAPKIPVHHPAPNKFQISKGSPPPTQSLPQIPSSTHTNDPTSFVSSQSCVSGFHRISDHGESRRARLSATTTPSWRHIWSSTHTKPPSLDHTRNCQPSPNQLSNFNLQQGSPPPTQSLPQIPSSTHTNDPTSLDHPPTPNTSPPSSTRQISIFNRGHRLPPNRCHRFDHPRTQTTPHHSIIHAPKIPVHHPALVKFQFSRGSPPPTHRLRTPTTPTITHLHNTPRTVRRLLPHLGVKVSDNMRCDVIIHTAALPSFGCGSKRHTYYCPTRNIRPKSISKHIVENDPSLTQYHRRG